MPRIGHRGIKDWRHAPTLNPKPYTMLPEAANEKPSDVPVAILLIRAEDHNGLKVIKNCPQLGFRVQGLGFRDLGFRVLVPSSVLKVNIPLGKTLGSESPQHLGPACELPGRKLLFRH